MTPGGPFCLQSWPAGRIRRRAVVPRPPLNGRSDRPEVRLMEARLPAPVPLVRPGPGPSGPPRSWSQPERVTAHWRSQPPFFFFWGGGGNLGKGPKLEYPLKLHGFSTLYFGWTQIHFRKQMSDLGSAPNFSKILGI